MPVPTTTKNLNLDLSEEITDGRERIALQILYRMAGIIQEDSLYKAIPIDVASMNLLAA